MVELCDDSRLANAVGTKQVRADFREHVAARGTNHGFFDFRAVFIMLRRTQNFGNDFVGAAHEYARMELYVLSLNIAVVIERGARHRRSTQLHRL